MSVLMQAIPLDQPKSKRKESPRRVGGALHFKKELPTGMGLLGRLSVTMLH